LPRGRGFHCVLGRHHALRHLASGANLEGWCHHTLPVGQREEGEEGRGKGASLDRLVTDRERGWMRERGGR